MGPFRGVLDFFRCLLYTFDLDFENWFVEEDFIRKFLAFSFRLLFLIFFFGYRYIVFFLEYGLRCVYVSLTKINTSFCKVDEPSSDQNISKFNQKSV